MDDIIKDGPPMPKDLAEMLRLHAKGTSRTNLDFTHTVSIEVGHKDELLADEADDAVAIRAAFGRYRDIAEDFAIARIVGMMAEMKSPNERSSGPVEVVFMTPPTPEMLEAARNLLAMDKAATNQHPVGQGDAAQVDVPDACSSSGS